MLYFDLSRAVSTLFLLFRFVFSCEHGLDFAMSYEFLLTSLELLFRMAFLMTKLQIFREKYS